jgi:hypothetical protein
VTKFLGIQHMAHVAGAEIREHRGAQYFTIDSPDGWALTGVVHGVVIRLLPRTTEAGAIEKFTSLVDSEQSA